MPLAQRRTRRWNLLAIVSVVLASILALLAIFRFEVPSVSNRDALRLASTSRALTTDPTQRPPSGWSSLRGEQITNAEHLRDQDELRKAKYLVQVGVYATSTSELELNVPSYTSSGYVWFRWDEPFQRYLEDHGTTIDKSFELLNTLITDRNPRLQPLTDKPKLFDDGSFYQLFTYQGRYYVDRASFRKYPFMHVSLPLAIEVSADDGELNYGNLRLEADIQNSGMGLYARIIGWLNSGWSIAEYRHHYATNLGQGGDERDFSQILYEISFGTSAWAAFWRLFLPVVIVMTMVLLVFKVRSDEQDARASIPVTVLLTLVFLQEGYRSRLPDLPYLTFLDQVYVVSYVVTLLAFVLVIWIGRRYGSMEQMEDGPARENLQNHLNRLDDLWPFMVVVLASTAIVTCWLTIPELS